MLSVIRNGVEYQLDDGTLSYLVGDSGWGMTPLHRITERGPLQHGASDRGFRLDPRTGVIVLQILGSSRQDLYDKRTQLLEIFTPSEDPLKLKWTLADTRQIDCFVQSGMEMNSNERSGFAQRLAINLLCPDPTFYDPVGGSKSFDLGGGSAGLTVPMVIPHKVGVATLLTLTDTINYEGNWNGFPHLIRITGPIQDPVVTNLTTGYTISFFGTSIANGDYYDIDTRYGYKTVVNSSGVNKIGDLSPVSDLATWHLQPGINSIYVSGSAINDVTDIQINYFNRFLGL